MAQVYHGKNPNQNKQWHYLWISIILFIPLAIYMVAFFINPAKNHFNGFYHLLPMIFFGWPAAYFYQKYRRLASGVSGENTATKALAALPDDYSVFTNVHLSDGQKRCEIDAVLVGPKGVFAIEVKGHNGIIEGSHDQENWTQHKVGRKGGEYSNSIKSPIRQLNRNIYFLANYYKQKNINAWINGIVAFSTAEQLNVFSPNVPVVTTYDLQHVISAHQPRRLLNPEEIRQVIGATLAAL